MSQNEQKSTKRSDRTVYPSRTNVSLPATMLGGSMAQVMGSHGANDAHAMLSAIVKD